jgi:hypothetical protein
MDAYFDHSIPELMPRGFHRLVGGELREVGLKQSDLIDSRSGYFAAVYKNTSNRYVFVNRGTEDGLDWEANFAQGSGVATAQYERAFQLARRVSEAQPNRVSFAGHSLGGGLAMLQALATNSHATVFNPAGLHPDTVARYHTSFARSQELITEYHIYGEMLSFMQEGGKYALAGAVGLLGGGGGDLAQRAANMPRVRASRHAIPAVSPPTQRNGVTTWGGPMGALQRVGNMLNLHYMSSVLYSLNFGLDRIGR